MSLTYAAHRRSSLSAVRTWTAGRIAYATQTACWSCPGQMEACYYMFGSLNEGPVCHSATLAAKYR